MKKLIIFALVALPWVTTAQESNSSIENESSEIKVFHLEKDGEVFTLHSCLSEEYYSPRLILPNNANPRRIVQHNENEPPIQVVGSYWKDGCLLIDYDQSELPLEDWIDLIMQFTILEKEQINLIDNTTK